MSLIQKVKDYFAQKALKKARNTKRQRRVSNYHQARDVGIVYISENESRYILAKQFVEHLKKNKGINKVTAMGFVREKEAPFYHAHVLHHDYFSLKNLNWYGMPQGQSIEAFERRPFDILIDMSEGNDLSLRFVVERSEAGFKVGRNPERTCYDLLIALDKESTLDTYLARIEQILNSINHHEERKAV